MEVPDTDPKTFRDSVELVLDIYFPQEGFNQSRPLIERLIWAQSLKGWNDAFVQLRLQKEIMGIQEETPFHDIPTIIATLCLITGINIEIDYGKIIHEDRFELGTHAETPFAEIIHIINLLGRAISMHDLYPQELLIQRLLLLVRHGIEGWNDYLSVNGNSRNAFISLSKLNEPIYSAKQLLLQTILNTFPQFLSRRGFNPHFLALQLESLISFLFEFYDTPLQKLIYRNQDLLFMNYTSDLILDTKSPEPLAKCLLKIARLGNLQDRKQAAGALSYLRRNHKNPTLGMGWFEIFIRNYWKRFTL